MNLKRIFPLLSVLLLMTSVSFSQDNLLPDSPPTTKEDFIKSEPEVINTINWLENTPLNQEEEKRKHLNAVFIAWLTNSPTVTVELDSKLTPFFKKNPSLLIIFMAGWTKYSIQNAYSKDAVKCNVAGLKSAIKVYQMGYGINKDKQMEKIIDLDSKNELESWVASQLEKK